MKLTKEHIGRTIKRFTQKQFKLLGVANLPTVNSARVWVFSDEHGSEIYPNNDEWELVEEKKPSRRIEDIFNQLFPEPYHNLEAARHAAICQFLDEQAEKK